MAKRLPAAFLREHGKMPPLLFPDYIMTGGWPVEEMTLLHNRLS